MNKQVHIEQIMAPESRYLWDNAKIFAQTFQFDISNIFTRYEYPAFLRIIKSVQQSNNGRLATKQNRIKQHIGMLYCTTAKGS